MLNRKAEGFTLLETIIVVVIIGILVAIALPNYYGMKERDFDKDGGANLKLIIAAQKIYRMETGNYDFRNTGAATPDVINANTTDDIDKINSILRLSLPRGTTRIWNYQTVADIVSDPQTTCAQATRTDVSRLGPTRSLRFNTADTEPVGEYGGASGTCP